MADDTDKFVLEYNVKVDGALKSIERLQAGVSNLNKSFINSTRSSAKFASDVAEAMGSFSPAFTELASVIRDVSSAAGPAALAMIALKEAIKAAAFTRDQFNAQRVEAREGGMDPAQLEDVTRQIIAQKTGNVSRPQVSEFVQKLQSLQDELSTDPKGLSPTSRKLATYGITRGMSTIDMMSTLGNRLHGASNEEIQAAGGFFGVSKDVMQGLAGVGGDIKNPKMDLAKYEEGESAVKDVNVQIQIFNDNMNRLAIAIGTYVLPKVTAFLKLVNEGLTKEQQAKVDKLAGAALAAESGGYAPQQTEDQKKAEDADEAAKQAKLDEEKARAEAARLAQEKKDNEEAWKKREAGVGKTNADAKLLQNQQQLAINAFSAAVATFANAVISKEEALAIWAGVSAAPGGKSPNGYTPTRVGGGGGSIDVNEGAARSMLGGAAVGSGESKGHNPGNLRVSAWSQKHGAQGAMGTIATFNTEAEGVAAQTSLLQNYQAKGFNTVRKVVEKWNPRAENANVDQYIAFVARAVGVDPDAILTPGQVAAVQEAMTQFEGARVGGGAGVGGGPIAIANDPKVHSPFTFSGGTSVSNKSYTKERDRRKDVIGMIADASHVTKEGVAQGWGSKGDIEWGLQQITTDLLNDEANYKVQLSSPGLTDLQRRNITKQQAITDTKLANIRDYSPEFLQKARPGDRELTQGEFPKILNVTFNGYDNQQLWKELDARLKSQYGAVANVKATPIVK
jgi:hypothetical protein